MILLRVEEGEGGPLDLVLNGDWLCHVLRVHFTEIQETEVYISSGMYSICLVK